MSTSVQTRGGAGAPDLRESILVCRNSQGALVKGSLLRLTRYSAVFEVYSPYSIIQLSEVLSDCQIFLGNRMVYSGRAIVGNLVNTGILLVCEANLDEAWVDIDFLNRSHGQRQLREQFEEFIEEWNRIHTVLDDFKVIVADMQTLFVGLQHWLGQVELGLRSVTSASRLELEREVFQQIDARVLERTFPVLERFERLAAAIPGDEISIHKTYIRRQIHPVVMCAPFVYRSYEKPLGYAGDYEMVNMMLRDPYEGGSLFAKTLNYLFLETPPVRAHRNRIDFLAGMLEEEVQRVAVQGRRATIYNLGCGPAKEVQRFLAESPLAEQADFVLLDFNDETVEFVRTAFRRLQERFGRRTSVEVRQQSVHQILKDAARTAALASERYDVIYCAGLFDYLSDRVCAKLLEIFYGLLAPGGLLVATNVSADNPSRRWMEFVVEWNLTYRSEADFLRLVPPAHRSAPASVKADSTGVNLFLEIRKPDVG